MKHLTWPAVAVFITVLAALATMFGLTDDPTMRQQILRYFDGIVPFILGVGAGAAAGGAAGYAGGYMRGQVAARAERHEAAELQATTHESVPQAGNVRRAAEVVRVATEESHLAAEDARATAAALHAASEEGREVVELQRQLLGDIRRAVASREHDGSAAPGMRGAAAAR